MSDIFATTVAAPAEPAAPAPATPAAPAPAPEAPASTPAHEAPAEGGEDRSMEETLRETFAEIEARGDEEETGPRARGPDGRFLPVKEAPAEAAPGAAAAPSAPGAPGAAPAIDLNIPPSSLTPAAKAEWAQAPESVRAEFHRREQNFHQGIAQYKGKAEVAEVLWSSIQPYQAAIAASGVDIPTAISSVLGAATRLQLGTPQQKQQALLDIAKAYGVALPQSAGSPDGAQAGFVDPVLDAAQQRIAQLEAAVQGIFGSVQQQKALQTQQEYAGAQSIIDQFASDPNNVYFPDVKHLMGTFIATGEASTLPQAYQMACRAHPQVYAALQKAHATVEAQQKAAAAQKARKLGSQSLRSTPAPGNVTVAGATIEDTLHEAYRAIQSR